MLIPICICIIAPNFLHVGAEKLIVSQNPHRLKFQTKIQLIVSGNG